MDRLFGLVWRRPWRMHLDSCRQGPGCAVNDVTMLARNGVSICLKILWSFSLQVVAVTPPVDAWVKQAVGFGAPEVIARDMANM